MAEVLTGDVQISREVLREVDEMLAQVERIAESDEQDEIDGLVHQLKVLSPIVQGWRNIITPLIQSNQIVPLRMAKISFCDQEALGLSIGSSGLGVNSCSKG